jgi:tetratricopeptide (TPR) repeat protein
VAIRERIGDTLGVTTTRNNLGIVYLDQERWEEAETLFVDNLARDRVADDSWGAACSSLNLGFALLLAGHPDDAARRIRTAIEGFVEVLDPDGGIEALETAIGVAVVRGEMVTAARMCGATDALRLVMDQPGTPADQAKLQRWLARCKETLGAEAYEASRQEGSVMTYEQAIRYALDTVLVDRPA